MKKLLKMLFRDMGKSKGQLIAIALVVFCGIALFMATFTSYKNLVASTELYYKDYKFLDYYAVAKNISNKDLARIRSLDGVAAVEGRLSLDISMETSNNRKTTLRMLTLPASGIPEVNRIHVSSGSDLSNVTENACLVSKGFASFYKIKPGATISVIINAKPVKLIVSGIANSPEYIWALKSSITVIPSDEDFGIVYVKESFAREELGSGFVKNEIHVIFDENRKDNSAPLIKQIETSLAASGFMYGVQRKNQLSYTAVDGEISELEELAGLFPILFLSVVAVTIYVMLIKLISNQRSLIGTIKALGYSNNRILVHYVSYSLLIGITGAVPGVVVGFFLSKRMTAMYNSLFNIPSMVAGIHWDAVLISVGLSILFSLIAGFVAARRVLGIQPAQAMRAEAPKTGHRVMLENFTWLWKKLGFRYKMSIRNVFRNRQRTLLTVLGLSVTIMLLLASMFFLDSIDYIMEKHFKEFTTYDSKITFTRLMSEKELQSLKQIEHINRVEPILEASATIEKAVSTNGDSSNAKAEVMATVITSKNPFYHFKDMSGDRISVKASGIMLYNKIAQKLSLKVGDQVYVSVGEYDRKLVKVSGISKQYTAFSVYMDYAEAASLYHIPKVSSAMLISYDSKYKDEVEAALYKNPNVLSVDSSQKAYDSLKQMMKLFYEYIGGIVCFGFIMGFVIVFNTTYVNIMERRRELATLKVLGYKLNEIRSTILRENMIVGVLAIIPGIALGIIVSKYLGSRFGNAMFSLDIVIYPKTYIISIASGFVFILLSQLATRRSIEKLEMVEVLKNREE